MFNHIPVGVGSKGVIPMGARDLEEALEMGMDWSLREGYVWAEDKEHCEEYGRMLQADSSKVSFKVCNKSNGLKYPKETVVQGFFNSRAAIAGAIIGLLLVFFYFVVKIFVTTI